MIRLLIVDDQELVRAGLRGILRPNYGFDVVGECGDGAQTISLTRALRPEIVLMDVRMPGIDGITATNQLRLQPDCPPILILTTFDDDEVLAAALRAGASGFLLKGVPAEDLQRAVRAVAGGNAWLDPAVTGRVLATYRSGADPRLPPLPETLTVREREVLALIGQGFTNAEISEQLVLSEGTVKTHINRIFMKAELRDRAAAVIFAFDHGLVLPRSDT